LRTMIKTGDLVHIPENVMLFRDDCTREQLDYVFTEAPRVGMVVSDQFYLDDKETPSFPNKYYRIFCMGKVYSVDRRYVFLLKKGQEEYVS